MQAARRTGPGTDSVGGCVAPPTALLVQVDDRAGAAMTVAPGDRTRGVASPRGVYHSVPSQEVGDDEECTLTSSSASSSQGLLRPTPWRRHAGRVVSRRTKRAVLGFLGVLLVVTLLKLVWDVNSSYPHWAAHMWLGQEYRPRLPHCIIIGVRKAGTSALLEFLNAHPDVVVAHDEIHFFDRDDVYKLGLEWYRQQMTPATNTQVVIEKTPAYYVSEEAPYRIYHMNSSVKLLLIVRNPVVRTISDYVQRYVKNVHLNVSYPRFEELVMNQFTGQIEEDYHPVHISLYHQYWTQWMTHFPSHQLHIVDGDNFVTNPLSEMQKVEDFLNLRRWLSMDNFYLNASKGFYCLKHARGQQCLGESKGRHHPRVDPVVLHRLHDFFAPHNQRFFQMTNRTFDWNMRPNQ